MKDRVSHSDAFTFPDGGFVVIKSKLTLYTTETFESQGRFPDNRTYLSTKSLCF